MKNLFCVATATICLMMFSVVIADDKEKAADKSSDELVSGLQVGDACPAFYVVDFTGPAKDQGKLCYRCQYGNRPVVSIFARKMNDNVARLIEELDAVVEKNDENKMAAFVVMLTDDVDSQKETLEEVAEKHKIKKTPLTAFDGAAGPSKYKIAEDADLTVMMWVESDVKVNRALRNTEEELTSETIEAIIADTKKILDDTGE